MGDDYGPIVVARGGGPSSTKDITVAVPGTLTTAYLALRIYDPDVQCVVMPFDRIQDAVRDGEVAAGLLIHEGQLTYGGHAAPNNVLQRALGDLEHMSVDVKALQRRRDLVVESLRSFGYDLHSPEGTFYLLPTSPDPDDEAFVERLAREKVFVLPGTVVEMPGRFRISITGNDDMVERALPVFERAAAGS